MMYVASNKKLEIVEKIVTIATLITVVRLVLIMPIVYCIQVEWWSAALCWFVTAACTDALDGMLARAMNECTAFGAILDAAVDKLLMIAVSMALFSVQTVRSLIPSWFYYGVMCKELLQVVGFCIVWVRYSHIEIRPSFLGKTTMFLWLLLMCSLLGVIVFEFNAWWLVYLMGAVLLTGVVSFFYYMYIAMQLLKNYKR